MVMPHSEEPRFLKGLLQRGVLDVWVSVILAFGEEKTAAQIFSVKMAVNFLKVAVCVGLFFCFFPGFSGL